ncbi:MAG: hypothetical protein SV760_04105 [Halobacteria archaeon]|nr:hypothetical protein [Halobacteria archaeon]
MSDDETEEKDEPENGDIDTVEDFYEGDDQWYDIDDYVDEENEDDS